MCTNEPPCEREHRDRMIARVALDLVRRRILVYRGRPDTLRKDLLSELDSWLRDLDERLESVIYELATRP